MNALLPRFLKSVYRKEPISTFIFMVGAVDALLGGFGERWTLLSLGLVLVISSVAVRWLQLQKAQNFISQPAPRRYLPPSPSPTPLPTIKSQKHRR
jgi:hypothetical protein